jgi:hypothetical protein
MTETLTTVTEVASYLSQEHDQYGYVEAEDTWITVIFEAEAKLDTQSEMLYYAASRHDGRPWFLSHEEFETLAEKGVEIRKGLPPEIEQQFFGDADFEEPDGDRFAHLITSRTTDTS